MNQLVKRKYKQAGDATKELQDAFNDWCSILTSHSVQAGYAIIGANWVVHKETTKILGNCWSKWSIILVVAFLGINLAATYTMTVLHKRRLDHAEEDLNRWSQEFQEVKKYWPYTECITDLGSKVRLLKCALPFIAAVFFIVSIFQ